jgi:hypothetical protein
LLSGDTKKYVYIFRQKRPVLDRISGRHTDRQTYIQTNRQTDKQTNRLRQVDTQSELHGWVELNHFYFYIILLCVNDILCVVGHDQVAPGGGGGVASQDLRKTYM